MSCTVWGLSCPRRYLRGGELLPRLFTLTLHHSESVKGWFTFCDTFRHLFISNKRPDFHRAYCRAVSGLSSKCRSIQRSSPTRSALNLGEVAPNRQWIFQGDYTSYECRHRYPTPRTVSMSVGASGSGSTLCLSLEMCWSRVRDSG